MKTVCVYCGSADNLPEHYLKAAYEMGATLAQKGLRLVYGAGRTGMMGAVANGALAHGGKVIGIIPKMFYTPVLAHDGLTRLEVTPDMHTRKARMAELADAFIALPGGFGTFDELFEIVTWAQIGLHRKPVGVLNVAEYFTPLLKMVEHAGREGFIFPEHKKLLLHASQPAALLDALEAYQPPAGLERWVAR
ncbi:MAG: TIGR00730 family Rossman fold protein [Anaerolineae bacterium]|nr:MAG: TIGR00730 family Rossman fold protein [Anaerolineae bacterium]